MHQLEFVAQRNSPYDELELFFSALNTQEYLYYQFTDRAEDFQLDAARDIQGELSARMKRPSHSRGPYNEDIDYNRFVPILIPWLSESKTHHSDEVAAAIDFVGYLKLESQREAVEALYGFNTYSDWDCVSECLLRLRNPASLSTLKMKAAGVAGADNACWALIRWGDAAQDTICKLLRTPETEKGNPSNRMIRVYLDYFNELLTAVPEYVAI